MNKAVRSFLRMKRWEMGAAVLTLCTLIPVSRAEIILDNTGSSVNKYVGSPFGEVFTMSGTSGNISALTLQMDVL